MLYLKGHTADVLIARPLVGAISVGHGLLFDPFGVPPVLSQVLTNLAIKGHKRSKVVTSGHTWLLMVTSGRKWSQMVTNGHKWSQMVVNVVIIYRRLNKRK